MITNKNKKFTMIELLVVIAIISILAALLLPTLNKVKVNANNIIYINKLKSIGTAIVMYIDSNQTYPSISDLRDDYLPENTLKDSNNQFFVMEEGITVNSGVSDAVIIDSSIPGYINTLYADGHVSSEKK